MVSSAPGEDKTSKHGVTACDGAGLLRCSDVCRSAPNGGVGGRLR